MKYFLTLLGVAGLVALVFVFRGAKNTVNEVFDKMENFEKGGFFETVKGNGEVVDSVRNLGEFSEIASATAIHVQLTKGDASKVVVRTDSNLQEHIETKVENGVLRIRVAKHLTIRKSTEITVLVSFTDLQGMSASSASSIVCEDKIEAKDFAVSASSAGKVKLKELVAENVKVDVSSASKVLLSGRCDELSVDASSASDADLSDLEVKKAVVDASSASDVELMVTAELEAEASSGADVKYKGNPTKVNKEESSGGDVSKQY